MTQTFLQKTTTKTKILEVSCIGVLIDTVDTIPTMFRTKMSATKKRQTLNLAAVAVLVLSNGMSFFAGTLFALSAGLDKCASSVSMQGDDPLGSLNKRSLEAALNNVGSDGGPLFPPEVERYAVGMVHTPKDDFTSHFDLGVPNDLPKPGEENVLILYSKRASMPTSKQSTSKTSSSIDLVSTADAIENCDYLNMILTHHDGQRGQCLAIVPQYESYHIQKWMRVPPDGTMHEKITKEEMKQMKCLI